MKNMKALVMGLGISVAAGLSFVAVAADTGSRNTLKDGGGYEKSLEQAGMSGMSGMSGNHSSTVAPADQKTAVKAKKAKPAKKVEKDAKAVEAKPAN